MKVREQVGIEVSFSWQEQAIIFPHTMPGRFQPLSSSSSNSEPPLLPSPPHRMYGMEFSKRRSCSPDRECRTTSKSFRIHDSNRHTRHIVALGMLINSSENSPLPHAENMLGRYGRETHGTALKACESRLACPQATSPYHLEFVFSPVSKRCMRMGVVE